MAVPVPTHLAGRRGAAPYAHAVLASAKERHNALPAKALRDVTEFIPPALHTRAARVLAELSAVPTVRPLFNLIISNVPGPPMDIYSGGARLEALFPLSIIADGTGLNVTIMSYRDSVDIGITADRQQTPDVQTIADGMVEELSALEATIPARRRPAAEEARRRPGGPLRPDVHHREAVPLGHPLGHDRPVAGLGVALHAEERRGARRAASRPPRRRGRPGRGSRGRSAPGTRGEQLLPVALAHAQAVVLPVLELPEVGGGGELRGGAGTRSRPPPGPPSGAWRLPRRIRSPARRGAGARRSGGARPPSRSAWRKRVRGEAVHTHGGQGPHRRIIPPRPGAGLGSGDGIGAGEPQAMDRAVALLQPSRRPADTATPRRLSRPAGRR